MEQRALTVRVHDEGEGTLWAEVLELPGCFATGVTEQELQEAVVEAIGLYLSSDLGEVEWGDRADIDAVEDRRFLIHG